MRAWERTQRIGHGGIEEREGKGGRDDNWEREWVERENMHGQAV